MFLLGLIFSISINAQNININIPQSYWDDINIDEVQRNAVNGDAKAQLTAALYYLKAKSDNERFKYWLEKAAIQNNSEAQYIIAECYRTSDYGFTQNNEKFKYWIEKAAQQNHAEALYLIAQQYIIGDYGFPLNEAKALEYARKAASLNNIPAIYMIAVAYAEGMFGLSQDDWQTMYWLEKAALLGDAYCQAQLGRMYLFGIGGPIDEKTGLQWLQKSAEQKEIEAQCMLISYYAMQNDKESVNKLISIGLDFLTNPDISQNSETILLAKGLLGFELFRHKNYKRGIPLVRESLKIQDELLQGYWEIMNKYAQTLGTTLNALEKQ